MTIKVACLQLEAFDINQSDLALENAFQMIDRMAESKTDLVVLPECVFPGYIQEHGTTIYKTIGIS